MVYLEYIVLYFRGASFSLRDRKKVQYVSEVIQPGKEREPQYFALGMGRVAVPFGTARRRGVCAGHLYCERRGGRALSTPTPVRGLAHARG